MSQIALDYNNKGKGEHKDLFEKLHKLIMEMYPTADNKVSYGILMYKIAKGWVALGYWKEGVSIYTMLPPLIKEFKLKHPTIKTGKGCINFRLTDNIPVSDIKRVIKGAVETKS